jgi:putative transcriptional regulator
MNDEDAVESGEPDDENVEDLDLRATRSGLVGHLLCAVPQLTDPNFARTVVLLLTHDADGAMGLTLNRATDSSLAQVAASIGLHWEGPADAKVRSGGPVEPSRGWIVHENPTWDPASVDLGGGLHVTVSLDAILEVGHHEFGGGQEKPIFLLGYAGWSEGQLDDEIAAGSWVAVPIEGVATSGQGVSVSWLLRVDPAAMWHGALTAIGVDPARLVGLNASTVLVH